MLNLTGLLLLFLSTLSFAPIVCAIAPLRPTPPNVECGNVAEAGAFLMLSDIHYAGSTIKMRSGATPADWDAALKVNDKTHALDQNHTHETQYPLLKSALDNAEMIAGACHLTFDYIVVTGAR